MPFDGPRPIDGDPAPIVPLGSERVVGDRDVDDDVVERDRLLIAARERHPHLDQEIAFAIDPQFELLQALFDLLPLRDHGDPIGAPHRGVRLRRDLEQLPQFVDARVGEILIDALLRLPDVDLLTLASRGPDDDERPAVHRDVFASGSV